MSADRPDRPGVAALAEELEVRRRVRTAAAVGAAVALIVFVLFAYLPETDESLVYWAGLAFVLAFAVAGLVATLLVAHAAYRRTMAVNDVDPGRPAPTTLAVGFGLIGWVLVPVTATIAFDRVTEGFELLLAVVTGAFVVLVVGGLGVRLVAALSLTNEWRPSAAAVGAAVYTALVAGPGVGCPGGGACLGSPEGLVAAVVSLDPDAVAPAYAAVVVGGGLLLGVTLGFRRAAPAHGVFAGAVATAAALPVVAASSADPLVVRSTALYLPVVLGAVAALGSGVGLLLRTDARRLDRQ